MNTSPSSPLPRVPVAWWVRVADGVALCLVSIAAWVAVVGSIRSIAFGMVLSMTSTLPCLYAAASVVIVRHLLLARPNLLERIRAALTSFNAHPAWGPALRAFLTTRTAVLLVGIVAVGAFEFPPGVAFAPSADPIVNLPARFDAGWYGDIALDGYTWAHTFQRQRNIAFFPALPLLMRPVGALFGMNEPGVPRERRMVRALWAGVVISLAAFLWALVYLVRLAGELIGPDRAPAAALLLAAYPFALFYSAPYTESLFLLSAIATCFHFRRGEWAAAMAWGVFAGLTRPNGCFLSVPLAILAVGPTLRSGVQQITTRGDSDTPDLKVGPTESGGGSKSGIGTLTALGVATAPVIGMMLFTAYLYGMTGIWFAWAKSHAAWGRSFQGASPFTHLLTALRGEPLLTVIAGSPFNALNALGLVFACALLWPVFRRLGMAWALFVAVNLLPPLLAGGVLSMGRFTSTLFPLFLALAALVPPRHVPIWTVAFGIGQGLCAALFFTWRDLY